MEKKKPFFFIILKICYYYNIFYYHYFILKDFLSAYTICYQVIISYIESFVFECKIVLYKVSLIVFGIDQNYFHLQIYIIHRMLP